MSNLRRMIHYLGTYKIDAVLGILIVAIETSIELFIPVLMARIIDEGIAHADIPLILHQGALMLACAVTSLVLGFFYARFASRASVGLGANLRQAEYEKIQRYAFGNLDHYQTSSLVTRMTTDITVIQNAMANGFRPCVRGPMMLVMSLVYAFSLNRELAMVFVCILPVLAVALGVITWRVSPLYQRLQTSMDHVNRVVQENLTAVRAVKAYVREPQQCDVFGSVNSELAQGGYQDVWNRSVQPAGIPSGNLHGSHARAVGGRPDDLRKHPDRGRAHGLHELCLAGHELADDDLECFPAAHACAYERGARR